MLGSIKSINEFDFAASIQQAAENIIHNFFFKRGMPENLCLTGGCGLNILINQQIREMNKNVYIPPNPSDCGLSVGQAVYAVWEETKSIIKLPSITYSGLSIQDIESLDQLAIERSAKEVDMLELAKDLKGGKIIGVCRDGSEVGPRSLGNRSILCDPVYPDMKDILNAKIKRREWYRPFAGICRLEDAHKFFDIDKNQSSEYMVFCPKVKEEYREALASITHVDGTCRIQTVTEDQNKFIFDLLSQESFGRVPVLLNTSFNINGKPILSNCKTALSILDSTPIDSVVIQDYHFKKSLD
jgi:carbamoyltransferase